MMYVIFCDIIEVVNSMPNSPIDFGSATLDSPVDVIASLNLQVKPIDIWISKTIIYSTFS